MKYFKRLAVTAFAAAVFSLGASSLLQAQDAPPGDAGNGNRLYLVDSCFTCHGRSGQGGAFNGPAPSVAKTEMPFDGFKAKLRDPANDMPAYSTAVLSDQEIADIRLRAIAAGRAFGEGHFDFEQLRVPALSVEIRNRGFL
jgi:mono/diheme cytochrome c family protein